MRTNFVELRASRLLKEPLRLSGEYQRPDEDTLVRQVRVPYVETTTITTDATGAGHATVAREGKSPRSFALSRSEEHTSELQSLMLISYAVFCLKKKITNHTDTIKRRDYIDVSADIFIFLFLFVFFFNDTATTEIYTY